LEKVKFAGGFFGDRTGRMREEEKKRMREEEKTGRVSKTRLLDPRPFRTRPPLIQGEGIGVGIEKP
jgi:hypothetical protein